MGLKKYKISKLISVCDERNSYGYTNFYGLNINKEFMPTWANTEGLDESKYKVVRKKRFVFSGMQTGRDECIRISMYNGAEPIIVSPAYTTFEITREDLVIPEYFFMLFLSKEKDRFGAFCSDGSIRSNLDWERFCDFDITLPSIEQQRKFVNVYLSLQNNLATYQSKVEELKMVCDGYLDKAKNGEMIILGAIIEKVDSRNTLGSYKEDSVRGITNKKQFDNTKADLVGTDLSKFLVVDKNVFAYNSRTDGRDMLVIALNREKQSVIVTWNYNAFRVRKEYENLINPEFLYSFFLRSEFDRRVRFNSWGSSQELLSWDNLCDVQVPFPDRDVQDSIANINMCRIERQRIADALKEQLKNICPVLIRGSLEE